MQYFRPRFVDRTGAIFLEEENDEAPRASVKLPRRSTTTRFDMT
jgi:hypothetical protein